LQFIADDSGVSLAEVKESYDTEAGRKNNEQQWVDFVRAGFKNGSELTRSTLDKLEEVRPGAVASFRHDYPEARIPNGYQIPEARSVEKKNAEEKKSDREAIKTRSANTGNIEHFGQKLGCAKKDLAKIRAIDVALTDADIAGLPLSKIWPASEIDDIENKFVAAVAFAARAEVPPKPRTSYKVSRWVDKVKTVRNLAKSIIDGTITEAKFKEKLGGFSSLQTLFLPKVTLLEGIDRAQWSRIGAVQEYPEAYWYDEDGKQIPSPSVLVEIDGKHKRFEGAKSVAEILDQMDDALGVAPTGKKMQFEVRINNATKVVFINKKGDKEYRRLKTFTTTKEAHDFVRNNYDDLVAAWEGVKASDNVLKTDVRSDENRPRSAQDWREGKDVTTDEFEATFGFRGTEFGNCSASE
jgi:hypothetical protein